MKGRLVRIGAGQRVRLAPARALAGLLVPVALAIASAVLGWAAAAPIGAVRAPGPAPVDALLALAAAVACAGLLALAAVGATVTLAVAVTGQLAGRWAALALLLTPHVVRAAVGLVVGVTAVGGQVGVAISRVDYPVTVAAAAAPQVSGQRAGQQPRLPADWSPDRPAAPDPHHDEQDPAVHLVTSEPTARGSAGRSGAAGSGGASRSATIVVHRGDTLWAIAARHLGPGADAVRVATEWPRWHAANRSTIGPDPDLILPGQRLASPHSRQRDGRGSNDREPTDREPPH